MATSYSISNIVLPLNALFEAMKSRIDASLVYSNLDMREVLTKYRALDVYLKTKVDPKIIIGYTRDPLKVAAGRGARIMSYPARINTAQTELTVVRPVMGQIDIACHAYFQSMKELEEFEVAYVSRSGIAEIIQVSVTIPTLDETFDFFVTWADLGYIDIPDNNIYKIGITFGMSIRGWFFGLKGTEKPIRTIELTILTANDLATVDLTNGLTGEGSNVSVFSVDTCEQAHITT